MSATPALHSEAFGKQKARQTLRVLFSENNKIIRRFLTIWLSSAELNLIYAWDEVITADFVMIWIFVDSQSAGRHYMKARIIVWARYSGLFHFIFRKY